MKLASLLIWECPVQEAHAPSLILSTLKHSTFMFFFSNTNIKEPVWEKCIPSLRKNGPDMRERCSFLTENQ